MEKQKARFGLGAQGTVTPMAGIWGVCTFESPEAVPPEKFWMFTCESVQFRCFFGFICVIWGRGAIRYSHHSIIIVGDCPVGIEAAGCIMPRLSDMEGVLLKTATSPQFYAKLRDVHLEINAVVGDLNSNNSNLIIN